MILHIDMDAFFASIEQAVNPRLKGKALIVGSRGSRMHTVVCAASYEAKALGIDSGMPSAEAFKICPDLAFVVADQSKYIWTSEQIFELLKAYGFELAYASIDEFQMDILDAPDPASLAQDIQKQIYANFNITASIGIAGNCLLAKLASKLKKPNGIAILTPDNLEGVLKAVPVKKLCGVGAKTEAFFEGLGLKTCLDLYLKSPRFLEQNLGKNGLNFYHALHSSERFEPSQESQEPKSVGHSYTLAMASANPVFIRAWIRLLSEMIARRLREKHLSAKTVHVWLSGPEMPGFGAQKTYQEPIDDGYGIYHRCLGIISQRGPKKLLVRALGVTCSSLFSGDQPVLFRKEQKRKELITTVDTINARLGEWTVYPAVVSLTRKRPQA